MDEREAVILKNGGGLGPPSVRWKVRGHVVSRGTPLLERHNVLFPRVEVAANVWNGSRWSEHTLWCGGDGVMKMGKRAIFETAEAQEVISCSMAMIAAGLIFCLITAAHGGRDRQGYEITNHIGHGS